MMSYKFASSSSEETDDDSHSNCSLVTLISGLTITLVFTLGVTFFMTGSRLADDFCDGAFAVTDLNIGLFIPPGIIIVGFR